jgi:S1-C subfamily serine protease
MAKFVFVYTGGQLADTPEAREQSMQEWIKWFGTLGDSVTDMGNPFGASATVSSSGVSEGGASKAGGYSIISADSLSDATAKAKGCPAASGGGSVEVYEALDV